MYLLDCNACHFENWERETVAELCVCRIVMHVILKIERERERLLCMFSQEICKVYLLLSNKYTTHYTTNNTTVGFVQIHLWKSIEALLYIYWFAKLLNFLCFQVIRYIRLRIHQLIST